MHSFIASFSLTPQKLKTNFFKIVIYQQWCFKMHIESSKNDILVVLAELELPPSEETSALLMLAWSAASCEPKVKQHWVIVQQIHL